MGNFVFNGTFYGKSHFTINDKTQTIRHRLGSRIMKGGANEYTNTF